MIEAAILVVFPFCMAFAMVSDTLSMTIANRVPLILIGSFVVLAPLTGMEWSIFAMHFAAFAMVLVVTFVLFALRAMGGGDAKLLAATALWIGFNPILMSYLTVSAILGGGLTLAILMFRGTPAAVYAGQVEFLRRIADPKAGVPYGIALGAAGLLVFPQLSMVEWMMQRLAQG